ncbi:MAG: 3-keto-5-aminohexanoate cleavage protein [Alphaproteobacteria bacterium]|nr:3-keto-5-aminohexanoate cleavage protein [Alphaproteobacteria bacterium]
MATSGKVIITCAITGSAHTPTMSPHLPCTPDEIAEQSIAAAQAGTAIVHLHGRQDDGEPTGDPEVFMRFLPRIKQGCDAVVSISSGGGTGMSAEERLKVVFRTEPELCTLNLGTMNFGYHPMIARYQDKWQHDWEQPYLESSRTEPFINTFSDIEYMLEKVGDLGTRFEFEAYDVGHLYTLAYYLDSGLVKPPLFVQTIFGNLGGIGPDIDNLVFMKRTADRLLGDDWVWSVLGGGRFQLGLVTTGAIMGSNVRVGLEDNLYLGKGELAPSNAAQVEKIGRILAELSLDVASPAEARELLGLKGADRTAF